MTRPSPAAPPARPRRSWLRRFADLFSSIWLGITLIASIIIYSALGSAVPEFRQQFELTEFHYFSHPAFGLLIALFCLNLTVATVRRIPMNLRNAGVLTVHTGLLLLCAGSLIYFGRKIEGDVWLDAPRIMILSTDRLRTDPERASIGFLPAVEGAKWEQNIPMLGGRNVVEVTEVRHAGLTTAQAVKLTFQSGDEDPRVLELDQSEPSHAVGKLNERLALWLRPANVADAFYDDTTPALIVAARGMMQTFELPTLPYYHERFLPDIEPITDTHGKPVAGRSTRAWPILDAWQMPISLTRPDGVVEADWKLRISIDGYLPYAELQPRPVTGGNAEMPIARVRITRGAEALEEWLLAKTPDKSFATFESAEAAAEFKWIDDAESIDSALGRSISGRHVLDAHVKDKGVTQSYDVQPGQEIKIDGTPYTLTIEELRADWPLMTPGFQGARTPIALVWVKTPEREFQRSVLARYPDLNQDRDRAGKKISAEKNTIDDNLELRYFDASRDHFTLVAGRKLSPTLIHTAPGGARKVAPLTVGQPYDAGDGLAFALTEFIERPRFESAPKVIPPRQRRPFGSVRRGESLVRVHLQSTDGQWSRRVWVPFSYYNCEHLSQADPHDPTPVAGVPGVGELRLIYGRTTRRLPGRLALERLQTDFYPGRQQPSQWTSHYRAEDLATGRVELAKVWLNNTARVGPWTLYQSQAAGDHQSWSVLGVGNRQGVMTMLAGCILISLGMAFAFFIKPIIVRRRNQRIEASMHLEPDPDHQAAPRKSPVAALSALVTICAALGFAAPRAGGQQPVGPVHPSAGLARIVDQIDLQRLGLLALQHQWRYSTVDSWARDCIKTIHGAKPLFDLPPVAAAMELAFNGPAHHHEPIIYVKDKAILRELISHPVELPEAERKRLLSTRMVSLAFLSQPRVAQRLEQLAGDVFKKSAMDRLSSAIGHYQSLAELLTIVPDPTGTHDTPWLSPSQLLSARGEGFAGAREEVLSPYRHLAEAWRARDVAAINAAIAALDEVLPKLAPAGIYPSLDQRRAEVAYRKAGLLRWAWGAYILAFFTAIFAVGTRFRWVRTTGLVFLFVAIALHGYDIAMRWQVLGRIPVANMFEAVVSSTWIGVVFGLVLELFMKRRVFLLSSALLGFFALALPELLPNQLDNKLVTMMPILDDIMLRIHTVLIISSYAVITLAYGVANCYLFVSAFRDGTRAAQAAIGAQLGAIVCLVLAYMGRFDEVSAAAFVMALASGLVGGALVVLGLSSMLLGGRGAANLPLAAAFVGGRGGGGVAAVTGERDLLAEFDLSHRVLLYTAMIALFVGLVLGAVWADYSWGRPWGWDPKEVFALETWLVYAILIHARFVTKRRGLWTSVLSVLGFAAMQFNWWVVNFYIVGLHSYA